MWSMVVTLERGGRCEQTLWPAVSAPSAVAMCLFGGVAAAVAGGATELELGGDGVLRLFVGGDVVVAEEGVASAVDAGPVGFVDDALLSGRGVPPRVGDVDFWLQ